MILQSLYNYYNILLEDTESDIAPPGYSTEQVSHALNLSKEGKLLDIIPLYTPVQMGKKTIEKPRRMIVPARVKRTGNVAPNFLCDNAIYVLGLTDKDTKKSTYSQERFESFRKFNIELLSKVKSPTAQAIVTFLQNYSPEDAKENPLINDNLKDLQAGSNLIFYIEGKNALEDPEIKRAWEDYSFGQEAVEMQCLVTGTIEPIARLHPDIKGVTGAQTKGASLVSFNLDAFTSYNKEQGENSPISRTAASGYTTALNYLLSNQNPNRKISLGDTTVVYWADSIDKRYANIFYTLLNPESYGDETKDTSTESRRIRDKDAEKQMGEIGEKVQAARAIDISSLSAGLDKSTQFYILGLAPNAARLSIRFFLTEPFGVFVQNIMQHYEDLKIQKEFSAQPDYISPYRIIAECVSPKVKKRDGGSKKLMVITRRFFNKSILLNTPYPASLYTSILCRIRHDTDETTKEEEEGIIKSTMFVHIYKSTFTA
jgi:CRISPR-associated protein Csd1